MKMFDAPIAGANYAADTRNYPWHRPPDIVNYDDGVGYLIERMKEPEQLELVFSLLDIDAHVSTVVTSLLMQGISRGKFSIDLAVLMAGPLARYISIIADEQDIKYEMGVNDKDRVVVTPTSLKLALGIYDDDETLEVLENVDEELAAPSEGLMGVPSEEEMASKDEQSTMLGFVEEEEEEPANELA
jgi:hypothetical protein